VGLGAGNWVQEEKARELRLAVEQNHAVEISLATMKAECDTLRTQLAATKEDAEARVRKWKAKVGPVLCIYLGVTGASFQTPGRSQRH
jgi:hypothetical protein